MGYKDKLHWKCWDALCVSKKDDGMGFRYFHSFNMAMLGKQWWRVMQNPNSLSFKVFQARYYSSAHPWNVAASLIASILWKSLLKGRTMSIR